MVEIVGNGLRRDGNILVYVLRLVVYILGHWVIATFRAIVGLRYRVSNMRPLGPIQFHYILLANFVVSGTIIL